MRFSIILISILAVVPSLAAPIDPVHFEELEARWHIKPSSIKKFAHNAIKAYKKVAPIVRKVAPIAKQLAPLIAKRDGEMEENLHRRDDSEFEKREEGLDALE